MKRCYPSSTNLPRRFNLKEEMALTEQESDLIVITLHSKQSVIDQAREFKQLSDEENFWLEFSKQPGGRGSFTSGHQPLLDEEW